MPASFSVWQSEPMQKHLQTHSLPKNGHSLPYYDRNIIPQNPSSVKWKSSLQIAFKPLERAKKCPTLPLMLQKVYNSFCTQSVHKHHSLALVNVIYLLLGLHSGRNRDFWLFFSAFFTDIFHIFLLVNFIYLFFNRVASLFRNKTGCFICAIPTNYERYFLHIRNRLFTALFFPLYPLYGKISTFFLVVF